MTEPIGRKPINFGGVVVDENQIKNKKIEKGLNKDTYIIEFKSGVTARYQLQNQANAPALNSGESEFNKMSNDKVMNTEAWNIKGLSIEGSSERDNITLHDCEYSSVNTFGDDKADQVTFDGGKYNTHFDD